MLGRFVSAYTRPSQQPRTRQQRFVEAAYQATIGRSPDADGLEYFSTELAERRISPLGLFRTLMQSEEYQQQQKTFSPVLAARLRHQLQQEYRWLQERHPDIEKPRVFVRAAYRVLLRREPDPDGEAFLLQKIAEGRQPLDLIDSLMRSEEFAQAQGIALRPWLRRRIEAKLALEQLRLSPSAPHKIDDLNYLDALYRAAFGRSLNEAERANYTISLQRQPLDRRQTFEQVLDSIEFKKRHSLPIHHNDAFHQARQMLFQQHLPHGDVIVDLGGAAHNAPYGALLAMGYPHKPRHITIVDLPPDDRIGGTEAAELSPTITTADGIDINYLYRSMAELDPFPDNSVDVVISGESIEHISPSDAVAVCKHTFRILKPGGFFCLDTPNALLTRLQSPDKFIHPEHQKEYYVHELRELLEQTGFQIVDAKGINPMPQSIKHGRFDFQEAIDNITLSDNPDEGYMFYFQAQKPITTP